MAKILLAEHNPFLINIYAAELRKLGHSVSIANDGEIAISRLKSLNPDLIILDAGLSKINGFDVLKIIKRDLWMSNLKIVMISDYENEDKIRHSIGLGIEKHLFKAENTAKDIADEVKILLS